MSTDEPAPHDDTRPAPDDRDRRLLASWHENADAWTGAVRGGLIASRRLATDAAILQAVRRLEPRTALDLGCGEGWLVHALELAGVRAAGMDVSEGLIAAARQGPGTFLVGTYDALAGDPSRLPGPFDVVVANFSLLAEDLRAPLAVARARLAPGGALILQTLHPLGLALGPGGYTDGWREETFAGFGDGGGGAPAFRASMPWFGRTLERWSATLEEAGFAIARLEEPLLPAPDAPDATASPERTAAPASSRDESAPLPASLLLTCRLA